mmetsp:Transcript_54410/g.69936  ORF Transcript_54410/g.69936 Transcript_54410/m.69936 type:complete len:478 (+) Transcript_54410:27-1460(+)
MEKSQTPIFKPKRIAYDELKNHRTLNDAWMSMGNKVYDISGWKGHPGGSVIFTHAGEDMTDAFNLFHPPAARKFLDQFYIGEIIEGSDQISLTSEEKVMKEKQRKFEMAYRDLRGKMISAGLFKLNYFYYVYKFASQILLVAAAAYAAAQPGYLGFFVGAALLGLFWQQSGWLCHDICHNQLCQLKEGRASSFFNYSFGLIFGNLAQGFSVSWWKDKHNRHHAVPNVHGGEDNTMNADPDIDTMPLLAWSRKMAALGKDSKFGRFMISVQKFTYLPLLCLARFSWLSQSVQFAWNIKGNGVFENSTKSDELEKVQEAYLVGTAKTVEQVLLILHHTWVFLLCAQRPTIASALGFWMLAQVICGFILFAVTSLGHNGLPVYEADERPDYWKLQVTTTRNITGNWLMHWFCGGLEYQVDHHLFPMMPRHSLPKAHEIVVAFCKEHDIKFNEDNFFHGTWDIIKHLDVIATEFVTEFPAM